MLDFARFLANISRIIAISSQKSRELVPLCQIATRRRRLWKWLARRFESCSGLDVYRCIVQKICVVCGWIEAVFVFIGGACFLFARTWGTQNVAEQAHVALGIVCLAFSGGIALATCGVRKGSDLAQTPFVLIQVFVGIGAYLGIGSTSVQPKILGGLAMALAVIAAVTAVLARRSPKSAA